MKKTFQQVLFLLILFSAASAFADEPTSLQGSAGKSHLLSQASDEQPVASRKSGEIISFYNKHRLEFKSRQGRIGQGVESELNSLQDEIKTVESELEQGATLLKTRNAPGRPTLPADIQEQLETVSSDIAGRQAVIDSFDELSIGAGFFFSPWIAFMGSNSSKMVYFLLPITILNIVLFLLYREQQLVVRFKSLLVLLIVIIFLASASALMAAEGKSNGQNLARKLRVAETLLSLKGPARAIALLEAKGDKEISLDADLRSKNPNLIIYNTVVAGTPTYFMTLAALHDIMGEKEETLAALNEIINYQGRADLPSSLTLGAIRYLVENSQQEMATLMVTTHADSVQSLPEKLKLTAYLEKNTLPEAAQHVLSGAMKKAGTPAELIQFSRHHHKQKDQDGAALFAARALKKSGNLHDVLMVAKAAEEMQIFSVFEYIPTKISSVDGTVSAFIDLAHFYNTYGETEKIFSSLEKSLKKVKNINDLSRVASAVIELKQPALLEQVTTRAIKVLPGLGNNPDHNDFKQSYGEALGLTDWFLQANRVQDASSFFTKLVERIDESHKSQQRLNNRLMLKLAQDGIQKGLKNESIGILMKIALTIPRSKTFSTFFDLRGHALESSKGLPNIDHVSLPLYLGLIYEDLGQLDMAEQMYTRVVTSTLDKVNSSNGTHIPTTMNEFHLLGRLLQKQQQFESLESLDRVYTLLDQRIIDDLTEQKRREVLTQPRETLQLLKEQWEQQLADIADHHADIDKQKKIAQQQREVLIQEAREKLGGKQLMLARLNKKMILKGVGLIVAVLSILALVVVNIVLAWRYSKRVQEHRLFGFLTRFLEIHGWLRIFSIMGLLSGLVTVSIAQLFQIIQKLHEISLSKIPGAPYAPAAVSPENGSKDKP